MTSNEEEETSGEMLVLGAEDCLRKPLTDGVLRMRINKVRSTSVREWDCCVPGLSTAACAAGCACRRTSVTGGGALQLPSLRLQSVHPGTGASLSP